MRVEKLKGRGFLEGKDGRIEVAYSLNVDQEVVPARSHDFPSATIQGMKTIAGEVSFADPKREPRISDKLTLHLEDERKLSVLYMGCGRVQATGGFH